MRKAFDNPFTRKRREALAREREAIEQQQRQLKAMQEQAKLVARTVASGATAQQAGTAGVAGHRSGSVIAQNGNAGGSGGHTPSVLQLLTLGQDVLGRLRGLPATDLEAFPLVNEAQRAVQRLREAVTKMEPPEQEVWLFQIRELEDDIRSQTERIMADASSLAAPPVNPSQRRSSSGLVGQAAGGQAMQSASSKKLQPYTSSTAAASRAAAAQYTYRGSTAATRAAPAPKPTRTSSRRGYEPPAIDSQPAAFVAASGPLPLPPHAPGTRPQATTAHTSVSSATAATGAEALHAAPRLSNRQSDDMFSGLQVRDGLASHGSVATAASAIQAPIAQPTINAQQLQPTPTPSQLSPAPSSLQPAGSRVLTPISMTKAASLATPRGLAATGLMLRQSSASGPSGMMATAQPVSPWSAGMTAAVAASYAAEAGVKLDDMGQKKVIKKKTRGFKVGYGLDEDAEGSSAGGSGVEMSSVIPGQPMPGPEYMAATRSDDVGSPTLAQQALIAARQAYLQQQAAATAAVAAACTPSAAQLASPVQAAAPTSPAAHTDLLLRLSEPAPAPQMPQPLSPHMAVPAQQPTAVPDLEGQAAPVAQGSPDSVQALKDFLAQLTGPLPDCQQAATVAAAKLVQSLAGGAQQALAQQSAANERAAAVLAKIRETRELVAQIRRQQAVAAASDNFQAASSLEATLKQTAEQADRLQAGLLALRKHAGQLADQRTCIVAQQAEACAVVSAYLRQLHNNHSALLVRSGEGVVQGQAAAQASQAAARAAIQEARAALAARRAQLSAAAQELESRVREAVGPLQSERADLMRQQARLGEDLARLRAAVAEREAALMAVTAAQQQLEQRAAGSATQLLGARQQLAAQQEALLAEEQALEVRARDAEAACAAVVGQLEAQSTQHGSLTEQGASLQVAASKLSDMATRIAARVRADREAAAARGQLQGVADTAYDTLSALLKRIREAEAQLADNRTTAASLDAQLAQLLQLQASTAAQMPALEAAKAAAAAQRDFKEAGRLHALLRTTSEQSDTIAQRLEAGRQQLAVLHNNSQRVTADLGTLRAEEPRLRREAAFHRFTLLTGSIRARVAQLQEAGGAPAAAEALRVESELEAAEARDLAEVWGFQGTIQGGDSTLPQQAPVSADARPEAAVRLPELRLGTEPPASGPTSAATQMTAAVTAGHSSASVSARESLASTPHAPMSGAVGEPFEHQPEPPLKTWRSNQLFDGLQLAEGAETAEGAAERHLPQRAELQAP